MASSDGRIASLVGAGEDEGGTTSAAAEDSAAPDDGPSGTDQLDTTDHPGSGSEDQSDDDDDNNSDNGDDDDDDDDDEEEEEDEEDEGMPSASAASSRAGLGSVEDGSDDDEDDGGSGDDNYDGSDADEADEEDNDDDEDEEEEDDSDNDKKPAAKPTGSGGGDGSSSEDESSSEEESGSDDESSSEEEEAATHVIVTDEFGNQRKVSQYEAMRLERIRRNKERLASLGLEGSLASGHTAELEKKREERRKRMQQRKKEQMIPDSERRSSSRKRKEVSYSELKEPKTSGKSGGGSSTTSNRAASKWRTEKPREQRVPIFIYREFQRMETERKQNLKRAEKNARAADVEYRFAKKAADKVHKTIQRREEIEHHRRQWQERQQERKELKEFFQSIDVRKQELMQARNTFDQIRAAEIHKRSRNYLDHTRSLADAMTRYPQAVQESEKHLDHLLLERCPNDLRALPDMGASLSSPGPGSKRKKKKKSDGKARKPKKSKKGKKGTPSPGGGSMTSPDYGTSPGFGISPGFGPPAAGPQYQMVQATPSPGPAVGMPFASPMTGALHPTAAHRVYQSQQRAMQTAMARLAAGSSGRPPMLPPNASGYPNLTGSPAFLQIGAAAASAKPKKTSKGKKKKGSPGDVTSQDGGDAAKSMAKDGKVKAKDGKAKQTPDKGAAKTAPDWIRKSVKKKKIRVRNVGGPVPEEYAKNIQRGWLDTDDAVVPSGSKQFIPQAGDLVLYYPRGHKLFLESHTDHLGKKTKQQLRMPLWERARKEKGGTATKETKKKGEGKSDESTKPAAENEAKPPAQRSKHVPERFRDDKPEAEAAVSKASEEKGDEGEGDNESKDGEKKTKKKQQPKKELKPSPPWWNDQWLTSMEGDDGGTYPILCRVENTMAEFPYNKGAVDIATNRKTSWSGHIDKMKKDQIKKQLAKKKPLLRLAVMLKPLTALTPPTWKGSAKDRLVPPPPFTAVVFRSVDAQPFILPFFWTYRQSHSLNIGDRLQMQFDDDIYTGSFESLADESGTLEKAFTLFPEVFHDDNKMPLDQRLEQLLVLASSDKFATIPFEDIRAVLQYISYYWHKKHDKKKSDSVSEVFQSSTRTVSHDGEGISPGEPLNRGLSYSTLVDLICTTLPKWENALVRWDDETLTEVSPWEIDLLDSKEPSAVYPGCRPGNLISTLGGKLLEDLRLSIQSYIDEHAEAATFVAPVDVKATPAYPQYVPLAMSIQRVLGRLEERPLKIESTMTSEKKTLNQKCCYYRSVASVISDLNDIAHNCVLYNDPNSEIAKSVRNVVEDLKYIAESLETMSHRKPKTKKGKEAHSVQMLLWQSQFKDSRRREREPFVNPMRRQWAEEVLPDRSWGNIIAPRLGDGADLAIVDTQGTASAATAAVSLPESEDTPAFASTSTSTSQAVAIANPSPGTTAELPQAADSPQEEIDLNSWVPQVGDEILYSRNEHCTYLRGHFSSLSDRQRTLPSILPPWMQQYLQPQQQPQQPQAQARVEEQTSSAASIAGRAVVSEQVFTSWLVGTIASLHATFPPPPPDEESSKTFDDLTPILEVGIHFNYPWLNQKFHLIHWRPCQVRGTDPVHRPLRKKAKKSTFRPIRVKALVKKKDVNPGRQLYFKPQAMKKNPRLARALGIKKQAVRINIKVNNKNIGPPTKKTKVLFIDHKRFEQDEELSEALFGDDATRPAQIVVKVDGKSVQPKPILLSPYVIDNIDGLSDALDNAGVGEFSSTNVFVKVKDQKILRKPILLPPYVIEKVGGLADAIGSKRKEAEPEETDEAAAAAEDAQAQEEAKPLIGETEDGHCRCCGLDSEVSFLRPAWIQSSNYRVLQPMQPVPRCQPPPGVPPELTPNIIKLLDIMKQRSIEGISPDSLRHETFDADAANASRQDGAIMLLPDSNMPTKDKENLARLHFLPPWFAENANDEVRDGVRKSDAFLPLPYLCLDLVLCRLKQGYYRNLIGATHDIREAYVVTVMYLLTSEGIESLKKMAVLLTQRPQPMSNVAALPQVASPVGEARKKKKKKPKDGSTDTFIYGVKVTLKEAALFKRIERVRKLYAAALACFTHTVVAETAFGKEREGPTIERVSVDDLIAYQRQMATRKKISHLLELINPDRCAFRRPIRSYQTNPTVRVKVTFRDDGGDVINDPPEGAPAQLENWTSNGQPPAEEEKKSDNQEQGKGHGAANEGASEVDNTGNAPASEDVDGKDETKVPADQKTSGQGDDADDSGQTKALGDVEKALTLVDGPRNEGPGDGVIAEITGVGEGVDGEESIIDVSQPLLFEPMDYISSADLVRALFGIEGRRDACVRCKKASRSMFSCRVSRAHSTVDFDLDEVLGERGVDGLIEELLSKPELRPARSLLAPPAAPTSAPDSVENGAQNSQESEKKKGATEESNGAGEEDAADVEEGTTSSKGKDEPKNDETNKDEPKEDEPKKEEEGNASASGSQEDLQTQENASSNGQTPSKSDGHALTEAERAAQALAAEEEAKVKRTLEAFKKAQLAVQLAKDALVVANAAMDTPPALSQEFIQLYYPIDAIDGHYEICTVCGLGGDILCCETCPNVAHTNCAGLKEVPEGDWFCKLCIAKGKGPKPGESDDSGEKQPAAQAPGTDAVDGSSSIAKDSEEPQEKGSANSSVQETPAEQEVDQNLESHGKKTSEENDGAEKKAETTAEDDPKEGKESSEEKRKKDEGEKKPTEDLPTAATSSSIAADGSHAKSIENAAGTKRVSFEQPPGPGNSSSIAAAGAGAAKECRVPAAKAEEEEEEEQSNEDKVAKLESILQELKSLRQKPKQATTTPAKQQEETKSAAADGDTSKGSKDNGTADQADDDKKAEESDIEEDAEEDESDDDGAKRKRRRRPTTKPAKKPKLQREPIELGTKILKDFEGHGDFEGAIEGVPDPDDGEDFYRVRYIDGDEEDMSEDEAHACVEYWKEKNANAGPEDPNVRKRRKPKRFETVQAASEFKGKRKQGDRSPSKSSRTSRSAPGESDVADYNKCKVAGCRRWKQGKCNGMCAAHFSESTKKKTKQKRKRDSGESPAAAAAAAASDESESPSRAPSPARKRTKTGSRAAAGSAVSEMSPPSAAKKRARSPRKTDRNLEGGPHQKPRGRAPAGKVWDSHHGAWIDE